MEGSFPPRPDLQHPPGPPRRPRRVARLAAGAAAGALALIVLIGSVVVWRVQAPETPQGTPRPTPSEASSSPGDGSSPSPTSPLATLTVRRAGEMGSPEGWIRWEAGDGSFSFGYPRGTEPREPSFDDGLWELDSRGSAVHMYIYVRDDYAIGPDPMPFLEQIADGLTGGEKELRRSRVVRHGLEGLDLEYRDVDSDYRFFIRLYVENDVLYQDAAGYSGLLENPDLRRRAVSFLDSFRVHGRTVTGGS